MSHVLVFSPSSVTADIHILKYTIIYRERERYDELFMLYSAVLYHIHTIIYVYILYICIIYICTYIYVYPACGTVRYTYNYI